MKKILIAAAVPFMAYGCSTIETSGNINNNIQLSKQGAFEIKVRASPQNIAPLVYEFAAQEFGKSLALDEKQKGEGVIEVTFLSNDVNYFLGTSSTNLNAQATGVNWYSRNAQYGSAIISGQSNTVSSGGFASYQNSTLMVIFKDANGKRLYSADYKYKGGWDISGFVVNTPEEAARLCIKRVYKRMLEDKVF